MALFLMKCVVQVVERVGTSSRTSASSCFLALQESLENMTNFAEVGLLLTK